MKIIISFIIMFSMSVLAASPQEVPVKGQVLESIDAASYTYLRIKGPHGEVWAAVPQSAIKVGSDVTIENPMLMKDFDSKTLKRHWPEIYFGTISGAKSAANKAAPAKKIELSKIHVSRASGSNGKTVSEVFSEKDKLAGQSISVRAKVTKFVAGVMGKNWVHLSDGTGSEKDKTADLTVTTQGSASVGDVVLVKGKVITNKDFGSGYFYPVLIEDAAVSK